MFNSLGLGSPGRKRPTEAPGRAKTRNKENKQFIKDFHLQAWRANRKFLRVDH